MGRPRNTICLPSGENHGPPSGPGRFGVHRINFHIAIAHARKDDASIGTNRGFSVIAGRRRKAPRTRSIGCGAENIVSVVNRPDVSTRITWARRTLSRSKMRRRVHDRFSIRKKISTRCTAAFAQLPFVRPIDVHRENLVARARRAGVCLIDELLAIRRKIRFSVLSTRRELFDVRQMPLDRLWRLSVRSKTDGKHCRRDREFPD